MKPPSTYLSKAKDCLFFSLHLKPDGTVVIASTRQKHAVLIFSQSDVHYLARSKLLYNVAEALENEDLPIEYEENMKEIEGK